MPTEACFVHSEVLAGGLERDGMDRWFSSKVNGLLKAPSVLIRATRPSALGMSDPIWGPLIHIFVDEKKKCEG